MENNPMINGHHTEETKRKISLAKKKNPTRYWLGKKMGPMPQWWRDKVSKALKGKNTWNSTRIVSEETRKKHSEISKKLGLRPPVRRGSQNNMWKGGITPKNQAIRTSKEYLKWRDSIFERDDWTCQVCKLRGEKLRAHHIKKFCDFEDWRMVPFNGITICESCDLKKILRREELWETYFYENLISRGIMEKPFGWELLCDCYKCDPKVIDNIDTVYSFLEDAVKILGVTKQSPPYVFHSPDTHPDKKGISSWVPIIESGISVHTLTEKNYVSIDYYSCSDLKSGIEEKLLDLANKYFSPQKTDFQFVIRGIDYYQKKRGV